MSMIPTSRAERIGTVTAVVGHSTIPLVGVVYSWRCKPPGEWRYIEKDPVLVELSNKKRKVVLCRVENCWTQHHSTLVEKLF